MPKDDAMKKGGWGGQNVSKSDGVILIPNYHCASPNNQHTIWAGSYISCWGLSEYILLVVWISISHYFNNKEIHDSQLKLKALLNNEGTTHHRQCKGTEPGSS